MVWALAWEEPVDEAETEVAELVHVLPPELLEPEAVVEEPQVSLDEDVSLFHGNAEAMLLQPSTASKASFA